MTGENQEWQPPLPPQDFGGANETPQMSLMQTLTGIFFEPSETFNDLRKKPFPRLIVPLILCALLVTIYNFSLTQKVGMERIVREQLSSKMMEQVPEEAKQKIAEDAKDTTVTRQVLNSSLSLVAVIVIFAIMALLYWGLSLAFGGNGNYWHALAVTAYGSFPPTLIAMVSSLIILYFKSADDISYFQSQQGLINLNPTMFYNGSSVVNAILSRFDLFVFWGMFLASVGLQKCFKISAGASWAISIIFWLIGMAFAALGGLFIG